MRDEAIIRKRFELIVPHLNERQKRLVLAAEAKAIGYGGVALVSRATGVSRQTISSGFVDLEEVKKVRGISRRKGGGRKRIVDLDPTIIDALNALVEPTTRGDPESPLRWTCKSTRKLAKALTEQGYQVSHRAVVEMLKSQGYSLQANKKTHEGASHPDRDGQFRNINAQAAWYISKGYPTISVDTKKKELVGNFKNNGSEWEPEGDPVKVNVYDFLSLGEGKAIPYGIYDIGKNIGWVTVGSDHDTASFAVTSIYSWWVHMGSEHYPKADKLLICADGGGSNGSRVKLWKYELQRFADTTGLTVKVCHFPPGTSKWNKIEHRLFSHISINWRGRPLTSHEVVVELIGSTKTETGLNVTAELDMAKYEKGIKVTEEQMSTIRIVRDSFHGEWNYTIFPTGELK